MRRSNLLAAALAAFLSACGGNSVDPAATPAEASSAATSASPTDGALSSDPTSPLTADASSSTVTTDVATTTRKTSCTNLGPLPSKPRNARILAAFGVMPSETADNTAGIQAALDALRPGDWLVFPAGTYLHSKSLRVRVPGVVLWSDGATLLATNPSDTSIMLQADGIGMYQFRLHAVTTTRGSQMTQSRIAIAPAATDRVRNVTVRRNIIENGGAPGTPLANGSSATGIMVYHADNFLVAENTIVRTLADGIHVTHGSTNGRVIANTVRENGDDMIAVVSYMGSSAGTSVSALLANLATLRAEQLDQNILIAGNSVDGQYWGRGISVVGGENVTIDSNKISNTTYAAGVLLAHESSYVTFGVHNVLVRNNAIQHVQTTAPVYSVGTAATAPRTRHAGIEVHSLASTDELSDPTFSQVVAVDQVRVEGNTVDDTLADGIRLGVGAGKVGLVGLLNNKLTRIGGTAINILASPTPTYNIYCSGNTDDGNPTGSNLCGGTNPVVTGAQLDCAL